MLRAFFFFFVCLSVGVFVRVCVFVCLCGGAWCEKNEVRAARYLRPHHDEGERTGTDQWKQCAKPKQRQKRALNQRLLPCELELVWVVITSWVRCHFRESFSRLQVEPTSRLFDSRGCIRFVRAVFLLVAPHWLALFQEGSHALRSVLLQRARPKRAGFFWGHNANGTNARQSKSVEQREESKSTRERKVRKMKREGDERWQRLSKRHGAQSAFPQ